MRSGLDDSVDTTYQALTEVPAATRNSEMSRISRSRARTRSEELISFDGISPGQVGLLAWMHGNERARPRARERSPNATRYAWSREPCRLTASTPRNGFRALGAVRPGRSVARHHSAIALLGLPAPTVDSQDHTHGTGPLPSSTDRPSRPNALFLKALA